MPFDPARLQITGKRVVYFPISHEEAKGWRAWLASEMPFVVVHSKYSIPRHDWLQEQCRGRWSLWVRWYHFALERDAMMFKLFWGHLE